MANNNPFPKLPPAVAVAFAMAHVPGDVPAALRAMTRMYLMTGVKCDLTTYLGGCLLPEGWEDDFEALRDDAQNYLEVVEELSA